MLFAKKSFEASPAAMLRQLRAHVSSIAMADLDTARAWLVFAGQIEQACSDMGAAANALAVTDRAAELFVAARDGRSTRVELTRLAEALRRMRAPEEAAEVRIPEGFAWYALYPDSYAEAAGRWAAACWRGEAVTVIGLRSIGTTLSAVVTATLARCGVTATRLTLRPQGHPFAREACLPDLGGGSYIVVDEGPGLSGSSMASVAEALARQGAEDGAIIFLPGHADGPGAMADAQLRKWWRPERCWVGRCPPPPRDGDGLHWRFGGFAAVDPQLATLADVKMARQSRLAKLGFALPCSGGRQGWIGFTVDGSPLSRADLSEDLICGTLAPYVAAAAETARSDAPVAAGVRRIGQALAAPALAERVAAGCRGLGRAGDGRMSPSQWLRRGDGRVLKRDATGTDCDHSWAGPQSLLWDVAGAMAEWDMDAEQRRMLLRQMAWCCGLAAESLALAFHETGYCSLQLARAEHDADSAEKRRFTPLLAAARRRMEALA